MSSTPTTVEWNESDDDYDDGDWGEMEELNHPQMQCIKKNENLCWTCPKCNGIINVMLCQKEYKSTCYICHNSVYKPNITTLIYRLNWDSPHKYELANPVNRKLLRENILKRVKFWICSVCTFQNENMYSFKCEMCDNIRTMETDHIYKNMVSSWTCYTCSHKNKDTDFCMQCNEPRLPEYLDWRCLICSYAHGENEKDLNECKHCGYAKPINFDWKYYDLKLQMIVTAYCSQLRRLNIPFCIEQIIARYFIEKIVESSTITNTKHCIYVWRYKIGSKMPTKQSVSISIGLVGINDNVEKYILNEKSRKKKKYCGPFKCNDIITMELNYINQTLSFGINDKRFKHFAIIDKTERYKTYANIYSRSCQINIIDLRIISQDIQHIMVPKSQKKNVHSIIAPKSIKKRFKNIIAPTSKQKKFKNIIVPTSKQERIDDLRNEIITLLSRNGKIDTKLGRSIRTADDENGLLLVLICLKSQKQTQ